MVSSQFWIEKQKTISRTTTISKNCECGPVWTSTIDLLLFSSSLQNFLRLSLHDIQQFSFMPSFRWQQRKKFLCKVKIFLLDFRCKIFFFSSFYCHVIYYFDFYTNWKPILTDWVTKGIVRIYYKRLYESKAIFIII